MTSTAPAAPDLALSTPVAVRLSDWGVIRARGDDAAAFLNGQLTQETVRMNVGQAGLAGYCSPKGRLLASFVMWRSAPDEILLACSADLLAPTLKRLSMFVLRAKCKLNDASGEIALWGVALPGLLHDSAEHPIPAAPYATSALAGGTAIRLADAAGATRVLWAAPVDATPPWPPTSSPDVWNWLEVQSGVPRIVASTVEAFVPQMVNLELVGGVNFQKGCYPGQEIVARSQYRGTLKRRMVLAEGASAAPAGAEVFAVSDPDQPAGQVVLSASLPHPEGGARHAALIEVKRALTGAGELRVGAADGPVLHLRELPYEIPVDAA
ncbi:MAG: YgfZ/GcvT domain-containing protein [Vitreoscilla sp.]